ncbi:rho GTPase-activating protein gacN-like isoform X2 [Cloeon dipterum]|uniref:rho GTPase-activating protein gacN-like isoform X2 n=1 Tax=Cloeon dipterum TaxID=197152 RepID=UPI00321FE198
MKTSANLMLTAAVRAVFLLLSLQVAISYQDDYEESKFDFSDLCPLSYRVVQIVQNSSDQVFHLKKSLEDRSNDAKQIQALVKSGVDSTLEVVEKFGKYLEKMDRETRTSDRKMHQEIMVKLEQDGKKVSSEISSMFSKFEENNNRLFENMKNEVRAATLPILEELKKFERKVSQFDNEFQALESKTKTALGQIDRFNCSKYYEKLTVTTLQNGKKYYLGESKVTWRDAKHICEENDMSLASLKTRREIKLLWKVAKIDKESRWLLVIGV